MIQSVVRMQQADLGLNADGVLTMRVSLPAASYPEAERRVAFFRDVLQEIEALPGVRSAGATSALPLSGWMPTRSFLVDGYTPPPDAPLPWGEWAVAAPGYFRTMGIPLLRGREFTVQDMEEARPVAVVNAFLAERYWPDDDPIGQRVGFPGSDTQYEVVGVVGDVAAQGVHMPMRTQLYVPLGSPAQSHMFLVVKGDQSHEAITAAVRQAVTRVDPNQPVYGVRAMDFYAERAIAQQRFAMVLLSAFAAIGLVLAASGHTHGWPMPRGGSQRIADSLASYLRSIGGRIEVNRRITRLDDLPSASAYLFDVSPAQVVRIAGNALPARYRRRLEKFRHGPGIFKVDWALDGPIPWKCEGCRHAGTVHLGGTLEAVAESERAAWNGQHAERPFVLLAQQSSFDESRAPPGKHAAWAYSHVPHGSTVDMTGRIEAQVERYAPGFRDLVLARHTFDSEALEAYNPNYVGGDIAGGAQDLRQIVARPALRWTPYATPNPKIYLCSASTPPGGGVHGMCGYLAARAALRSLTQ
jgi:L-fucose mutarotase/ribose pyranase (RbsD/FucU family)